MTSSFLKLFNINSSFTLETQWKLMYLMSYKLAYLKAILAVSKEVCLVVAVVSHSSMQLCNLCMACTPSAIYCSLFVLCITEVADQVTELVTWRLQRTTTVAMHHRLR